MDKNGRNKVLASVRECVLGIWQLKTISRQAGQAQHCPAVRKHTVQVYMCVCMFIGTGCPGVTPVHALPIPSSLVVMSQCVPCVFSFIISFVCPTAAELCDQRFPLHIDLGAGLYIHIFL